MADQDALKELKLPLPTRLADLTEPQWKRNLILEDPRTPRLAGLPPAYAGRI